jgi:hypothetical protein
MQDHDVAGQAKNKMIRVGLVITATGLDGANAAEP